MNVAYRIKSAATRPMVSPLPVAFMVSGAGADESKVIQSQFTNSTSFGVIKDLSGESAASEAEQQPDVLIATPSEGWRTALQQRYPESPIWYGVAPRQAATLSSSASTIDAALAPPSEDDYKTTNSFPRFLVNAGVQALASKEAGVLLAAARAAALTNDMRTSYEKVFRGLDILLRSAQWTRISSELREMCSERYPVAFGIGAVRFASDAASRIPNWEPMIEELAATARKQRVDVARAMRGF